MKRRTETLDAEYKRRGLIRPNQMTRIIGAPNSAHAGPFDVSVEGHEVVKFDWKGTTVWGVKA